mgnify:FL=1
MKDLPFVCYPIYTEHKTIELIIANPVSKPPACIERWPLRLQEYDFKVRFTSRNQNPADFRS